MSGAGDKVRQFLGGLLPAPVVIVAGPPGGDGQPDERLAKDQLASIAVRLALSFPEWVERRVEHVVYLDDTTVRHRESVTLRWPEPEFFVEEARPAKGQTIYVPLDVIAKRPMIEVDVAQPDGSTFAILSTRRNGQIGASGITSAIWYQSEQQRNGQGLSPDTLKLIEAAVQAPSAQAAELLGVLDDTTTELGDVLKEPDEFRGLLRELGTSFLLLAPAKYEPGVETVLKYSYSQALPWKHTLRNITATFGLADFRSDLSRLSLGYGESYHIEVDAPDDVRLARARLFGSYVDSNGSDRVTVAIAEAGDNPVIDLHAKRPTAARLRLAEEYCDKPRWKQPLTKTPGEPPPPRDALQAAAAAAPTPVVRSDRGFAQVSFRPRVAGPFLAAVVISILTSALLVGARTRLPELDGQVGSAVLLALPVLAAGYLTRSGEHAFATRLLAGVRAAALGVGVCSLVVAGVLGGGFVEEKPQQSPAVTCRPANDDHRLGRARELRCVADPPRGTPEATVHDGVQTVVDGATWLAVFLSALLLCGLLRTWWSPTVSAQEDDDDDDVV
ncbi:MAG: hypothetical protein WKF96_06670 [Solirubrobacteraceae bacterium]